MRNVIVYVAYLPSSIKSKHKHFAAQLGLFLPSPLKPYYAR